MAGVTVLCAGLLAGAPPAAAKTSHTIPSAERFGGIPSVGALFSTIGGKRHFCTASVVDSASGDLVLTAAHCVYSRARGYAAHVAFVPGYRSGRRPYGTWPVTKITVAGGWRRSQDPDLDFAFLTVSGGSGGSRGSRGRGRVQARVGGLRLGVGDRYGQGIEAVGYNDADQRPVRCRTHSFEFRPGQREFHCHGFRDGTSGGPWITGYNSRTRAGTVIGVIGGYERGGDYEWASYSAYFGSAVRKLFRTAERPRVT